MKNFGRKMFALLLCVMLCCSLMPVYAGTESPMLSAGVPQAFPGLRIPASVNAERGGLTVTVAGSDATTRSILCGLNRPVKLQVTVTGNTGTVKYQWYELTVDNFDSETGAVTYSSKEAISGATKKSYTTPALTKEGTTYYYICAVNDSKDTGTVLFGVTPATEGLGYSLENGPKGVILDWLFLVSIDQGYLYSDYSESGSLGTSYTDYTDPYVLCNATKYQIYRKAEDGKWASLKTIKGGGPEGPPFNASIEEYEALKRSYTDTSAQMGTTYSYRYRGYINGMWTLKTDIKTITFNPFEDVSLSEDRAQYIAWAYNNSVVKGDGAGHFNPDDPCTRMNFVMILWKMHGKPTVKGSNPFTDVSGNTSVAAVKWAVKKKLVTGTSATTFSPDDNLSRINIIMILYKLAGSPKASDSSPYEDITGSKTTKAVNWAVSKGIISPVDTGHFDPDGKCSRALLVEVLCKYNEIYKIL